MTTSVTDDRARFEKWYIDEYTIPNNPPIDMKYDIRKDGSYGVPQRNTAWIAWQAALRSQGKVDDALTMTITAEAWNFIMGIGAMDGKYFGEPDEKGHAFWWRHKLLPTAIIGEGN